MNNSSFILNSQHLTTFPMEIKKHKMDIKILDLSFNNIKELPYDIGEFLNLEILCLSGNQLDTIPQEIKHLIKLKKLYIGFNQLISLPREINKLTNLEELYLYGNKIKTIPSLQELIHLKELAIDKLPNYLGSLRNLRKLYFVTSSENTLVSDQLKKKYSGQISLFGTKIQYVEI